MASLDNNVENLIDTTKPQVSERELKSLVTNSITKGISECQLDRDKKAKDSRVVVGSSLADRIKKLTTQIKGSVDCNKLQQETQKQLDAIDDQISDLTKEIKRKMKEILPIVKVPMNPRALAKYTKKSTIGRVLPDLNSTMDFIKRTAELSKALYDLYDAVDKVRSRLETCNLLTIDNIFDVVKHQIDKEMRELKTDIETAIAEAICGGIKDAKISQDDLASIFDTIDDIDTTINNVNRIQNQIDDSLNYSVGMVASYSADLQDLTGIVPPFDTSNTANFMTSINSNAYSEYTASVIALYDSPNPVNVTLPVITGNTSVGATLNCSNGVWSSNGSITTFAYDFQWYRNDQEIVGANTFIYIPVIDDVETTLSCEVTAETAVTIEFAKSNPTSPITFRLEPADRPVLSGIPLSGQMISCTSGTWPSNFSYFQYEWRRNDSIVVKSISSNNQYTIQASDIGSNVSCRVYASSMRYNLYEISNSIGPIA